jgi:hypothetical protein
MEEGIEEVPKEILNAIDSFVNTKIPTDGQNPQN